jgi:hypothetical protein
MLFQQAHEVLVLRHDDSRDLPRRHEDRPVFGVSQTQRSDGQCLDAKLIGYPAGQGRRKLRVDPDDHAASTG